MKQKPTMNKLTKKQIMSLNDIIDKYKKDIDDHFKKDNWGLRSDYYIDSVINDFLGSSLFSYVTNRFIENRKTRFIEFKNGRILINERSNKKSKRK